MLSNIMLFIAIKIMLHQIINVNILRIIVLFRGNCWMHPVGEDWIALWMYELQIALLLDFLNVFEQ